jgi:hypothetical protein
MQDQLLEAETVAQQGLEFKGIIEFVISQREASKGR